MGKTELAALLNLSSWCIVVVVLLFLEVPWVCLQLVIVVFPDHTHLLFLIICGCQSLTRNSKRCSRAGMALDVNVSVLCRFAFFASLLCFCVLSRPFCTLVPKNIFAFK